MDINTFKYVSVTFTEEEILLLTKHGDEAMAIMSGSCQPSNRQEDHFLSVCNGNTKPSNVFESAWLRYVIAINAEANLTLLHGENDKKDVSIKNLNIQCSELKARIEHLKKRAYPCKKCSCHSKGSK